MKILYLLGFLCIFLIGFVSLASGNGKDMYNYELFDTGQRKVIKDYLGERIKNFSNKKLMDLFALVDNKIKQLQEVENVSMNDKKMIEILYVLKESLYWGF